MSTSSFMSWSLILPSFLMPVIYLFHLSFTPPKSFFQVLSESAKRKLFITLRFITFTFILYANTVYIVSGFGLVLESFKEKKNGSIKLLRFLGKCVGHSEKKILKFHLKYTCSISWPMV